MRSPETRIALTHLLSKKRQTLVAMLGVTFGTAIFIFQAGLITGFQTTFIEQTINTTANIRIYNDPDKNRKTILDKVQSSENNWNVVRNQKPKDEEPKIRNGREIIQLIEKYPEISGVSPFLGSQAIIKLGIAQVAGIVAGVDIVKEDLLFKVSDNMIEGEIVSLETTPNGIILGVGLAEKLGAKMNDNLNIISPQGVNLEMKVVGINRSGLTELDNKRSYINIRNAQKLLRVSGSYITDINIKLKDIENAVPLAAELQRRFGYRSQDWKSANESVFGLFKVQKLITAMIIISILIVSGFGIFNILMTIIYEKMQDIAILKAIGFKDKQIRKIFFLESLIIGFIGGILGLILGTVLTQIIGHIPLNIKGFVSMEYLKFNSSPIFYIFGFCFALFATTIAGLAPARKAAKLDPIDIIRSK